jgi:2-(1,2-epoxy-1,2-dihydrophenyl)acetyl-CoA isomerase
MVGLPQPIVAAVHGWVVGAGVEWMLDADIVVAARTARLKLPEASLGVFVTGGISALLRHSAGLGRAKALMMLGDEFSAEQALQWGLIWKVVDDAALDSEAQRIAARLAALDPQVLRRFKRVLNEVGAAQFDRAVELETRMQTELGT